jgi:TPR repeat protein
MYETGYGVAQNKMEAMYWTKRAANQKYETARFKLLYWDLERKGLNSKNKPELQELNIKAKHGNAQAQYYLGKMYAHGIGIKENPEVAMEWLEKAATLGVLEAELELDALTANKQQNVLDKHEQREFRSDPCSGKAARYMSTCK